MAESAVTTAPGVLQLPEAIGKQAEMLDSPASRKVLRWGRRAGKTRGAFLAALLGHGPIDADGQPMHRGVLQGGDVVWICPTYSNLTTVLWKEEIVPRMGHLPWIHLNKQDHDVTIPGVGSLLLRSGDREAIDNVRGVGKRLFGVIVDEAAHMDTRGALLDVILPALIDNGGWLILMSTTNQGQDGGYDDTGAPQIPSYFNQLCVQIQKGERSKDWAEFVGTAHDNPEMSPKGIEDLINEYPIGSPKLDEEVWAKLLESGAGLALPGIGERHMVPAFSPLPHWNRFASFDWAFYHLWVVCLFCVDEDGKVYQEDTLFGRMDLPEAIDEKARAGGLRVKERIVFSGADIWRARVKTNAKVMGPTIAEELGRLGWRLAPAADMRVMGLNNARSYVHIDPLKPDVPPRFQWMDTPGNRACMAQVARMTLDPKDPEDVLKVDADAAGRGGDDMYDSWRYGLMSRPITTKPRTWNDDRLGADPRVRHVVFRTKDGKPPRWVGPETEQTDEQGYGSQLPEGI